MMKIPGEYPESDVSPPISAPNFSRFPELPTEICDQIWETAVYDIDPRIVTAQRKAKGSIVPALLHVSREARVHGTKRYTLEEVSYYYGFLARRISTYVWVADYDEDFVFFNYSSPIVIPSSIFVNKNIWKRNIRRISLKKVKKLAIGVQLGQRRVNVENRMYWPLFWSTFFEAFSNLLELNFVLRPLENGNMADIVDMDNDGKDLTWRERRTQWGRYTGSEFLSLCLDHHLDLLYQEEYIKNMTRKYSRFTLPRYGWDDIMFQCADTAVFVIHYLQYAVAVVAMFTGLLARSWINPFKAVAFAVVFFFPFEGI